MPRGESTPSLKKAATATNGTEIAATLNASIRAFKRGIVAYERNYKLNLQQQTRRLRSLQTKLMHLHLRTQQKLRSSESI